MLITKHLPNDLLDRHPVPTGHRRPPFVEALRTPTMMSAAVAGPTKIRPTPTYTTLRDVTVDAALIAETAEGAAIAFVCGSNGFVETTTGLLLEMGLDAQQIRTERFGPT